MMAVESNDTCIQVTCNKNKKGNPTRRKWGKDLKKRKRSNQREQQSCYRVHRLAQPDKRKKETPTKES
jgi:hypothetical protein